VRRTRRLVARGPRKGLTEIGIELDPTACATRHAAGHLTVRADVAALPVAHLTGHLAGLIASPPCQGMSAAGLHTGWADVDTVLRLLADLASGRDTRAQLAPEIADPRSLLIAEPLRYALAARPEWVACEQVPAVLPLWQATARHLRGHGYNAWTGLLNAADYGVPQTRTRAFLIASRVRSVHRPEPSHAQNPGPVLFGPELKPWASMADALGWHPADVVTTRGHRHTAGGNRFDASGPSWALTEKTRSWIVHTRAGNDAAVTSRAARWALRQSTRANASMRTLDQPAATLLFGHACNNVSWTCGPDSVRISAQEAAVLQGFPADYPWQGGKTKVFEQIGNAVPPPLARAVLAVATGRTGVHT
jgi:DNA (cytosine-5)-methyltransferase 1